MKKLISIALVAFMLLGMIPSVAFAESFYAGEIPETVPTVDGVVNDGEYVYATSKIENGAGGDDWVIYNPTFGASQTAQFFYSYDAEYVYAAYVGADGAVSRVVFDFAATPTTQEAVTVDLSYQFAWTPTGTWATGTLTPNTCAKVTAAQTKTDLVWGEDVVGAAQNTDDGATSINHIEIKIKRSAIGENLETIGLRAFTCPRDSGSYGEAYWGAPADSSTVPYPHSGSWWLSEAGMHAFTLGAEPVLPEDAFDLADYGQKTVILEGVDVAPTIDGVIDVENYEGTIESAVNSEYFYTCNADKITDATDAAFALAADENKIYIATVTDDSNIVDWNEGLFICLGLADTNQQLQFFLSDMGAAEVLWGSVVDGGSAAGYVESVFETDPETGFTTFEAALDRAAIAAAFGVESFDKILLSVAQNVNSADKGAYVFGFQSVEAEGLGFPAYGYPWFGLPHVVELPAAGETPVGPVNPGEVGQDTIDLDVASDVTVDGAIGAEEYEWNLSLNVDNSVVTIVDNPELHAVDAYLGYDNDNIYVATKVVDNNVTLDYWDCLDVHFTRADDMDEGFHIYLTPAGGGCAEWSTTVAGAQTDKVFTAPEKTSFKIVVDGNTIIYELAVDREAWGLDADAAHVAISVRSTTGVGERVTYGFDAEELAGTYNKLHNAGAYPHKVTFAPLQGTPEEPEDMLDSRFLDEYGQKTFIVDSAATVAPIIDGVVTSNEYTLVAQALESEFGAFFAPYSGENAAPWAVDWVNLYVTYDDECLYVAAEVYDPDDVPHGTFAANVNRADQFIFTLGGMLDTASPDTLANAIIFTMFDENAEAEGDRLTMNGGYDPATFVKANSVNHNDETDVTTYELAINWAAVEAAYPYGAQDKLFTLGVAVQDTSNTLEANSEQGQRTGIRNWGITGADATAAYAILADQYGTTSKYASQQGEVVIPHMFFLGAQGEYDAFKAERAPEAPEEVVIPDSAFDLGAFGQITVDAALPTVAPTRDGVVTEGEYTYSYEATLLKDIIDDTFYIVNASYASSAEYVKYYLSSDANNIYIAVEQKDSEVIGYQDALYLNIGASNNTGDYVQIYLPHVDAPEILTESDKSVWSDYYNGFFASNVGGVVTYEIALNRAKLSAVIGLEDTALIALGMRVCATPDSATVVWGFQSAALTEDGTFAPAGFPTVGYPHVVNLVVNDCEHVFDNGVVKKPADCGNNGTMLYTCTLCGRIKEETILATGDHAYNKVALDAEQHADVCEVCGDTINVEGHAILDKVDVGISYWAPEHLVIVCENCPGYAVYGAPVDAHLLKGLGQDHIFRAATDNAPTLDGAIMAGEYSWSLKGVNPNNLPEGTAVTSENVVNVDNVNFYVSYDESKVYLAMEVTDNTTFKNYVNSAHILVSGGDDTDDAHHFYLSVNNGKTLMEYWYVEDNVHPSTFERVDGGKASASYKRVGSNFSYELVLDRELLGLTGDAMFLAMVARTSEGSIAYGFNNGAIEGYDILNTNGDIILYPNVLYFGTMEQSGAYIESLGVAAPVCEHNDQTHTFLNTDYHRSACYCGEITDNEHRFVSLPNDASTHVSKCVDCGAELYESHKATYWSSTDAEFHYGTCACGESVAVAHIFGQVEVIEPATHLKEGKAAYTCVACDYTEVKVLPVTAAHSFVTWTDSGDSHWSACLCGATTSEPHTFVNGKCNTCGAVTEVVAPPVVTDPVETDPAETDPAETDPADTDPAETDPVDTDPVDTDKPADKDGCGGSIAAIAVALVAALGTCTVFVAKKKD